MKTIIGDTWNRVLTDPEYDAWVIYDESHPWLASRIPMEQLLDMFLCNYRMLEDQGPRIPAKLKKPCQYCHDHCDDTCPGAEAAYEASRDYEAEKADHAEDCRKSED